MKWRNAFAHVALSLIALGPILGCKSSSTSSASSSNARRTLDLTSVAQQISNNVGKVEQVSSDGANGQVFVFQEVHTSRIGQIQIATMLVRLHNHYRVKKIGLEGAIWSGKPLDAGTYHSTEASERVSEHEDVAVRMLADGEISSAELMTMLLPDVQVYGIEDAGEYGQNLDVNGSPELSYLLAISERTSPADVQARALRLFKAKKHQQALELMLTSDPWVNEQFESLKNSGQVSSEAMVERLRGLESRANEVDAEVSPEVQRNLDNEIRFMQTASERSGTMVSHVAELSASGGEPLAMIVGAAHSDKVTSLLREKGISFALIQPIDMDSKFGTMSLAEYERKDEGKWARNDPGTLGHVLNSRHKPPPIILRATGQSYASMNLAGIVLARAARSGGTFPQEVLPQLSNLPGLNIDPESIKKDGYDVIFHASLLQDDGTRKGVWARIGTRKPKNMPEAKNLEEKLLAIAEEFKEEAGGGGGKGGKRGKHGVADAANDPSRGGDHGSNVPGDFTQRNEIVSRIGLDTLVSYGSRKEEVMRIGRISD